MSGILTIKADLMHAQMNSSCVDESNLQSSAFGDRPARATRFHGWAKSTNPACTL